MWLIIGYWIVVDVVVWEVGELNQNFIEGLGKSGQLNFRISSKV